MRLWSFHRHGFSLTSGEYDPNRSRNYRLYPEAYEELWRRIGRTFVIWCLTSPQDWSRKYGYEEWELDVPHNGHLSKPPIRIIDSLVWDSIRGEAPGLTKRLQEQLDRESHFRVGPDPEKRERWIEDRVCELRNPSGNLWDSLFLTDPTDLRADVLLEHPIPENWVVRKVTHTA